MVTTTTRTRKPELSLVVPGNDEPRGLLLRRDSVPLVDDAQTSLKHKRLFPVACRVVPTDQWFTSRVDRTWTVLDLKLWLLSKALPTATLPLPAAFRPSSPVTFAAPPPRPQTASSYHHNGDDGDDEAGDNDDNDDDGPSSPMSLPPSPSSSFASDTHRTPRSIPYSFSTGAPAISGLDALKSHARARPELVANAEAIAHLWRVHSFSTGLLLADDLPLAEYNILPFELLELHRLSAYVRLPRPIIPHPFARCPDDPSDDEDDDDGAPSRAVSSRAYPAASASVAAAVAVLPARKPSPPEPRPMPHTDPDPAAAYAQPYFDGWLCVLTNPHASEQQQQQADDPARRRARAKSDARGRDKTVRDKTVRDRDREWSELQKLLVGVADQPVPPPPDPVSRWRRRWVMLRSGVLSVWRERRDPRPETEWDVAACVALHDADKIPTILGSSSAAARSDDPVICARFRTPPTTHHKNKPPRTPTPLSPWLVLKLPDTSTREHLLRSIHRIAYPVHPPTRARTAHRPRTLRTAFLPNPIPHPLALSFSQPPRTRSPRAFPLSPDLSSPSSPSSPSSSTLNGSDDDDSPSGAADAQDNTMGLGPGMGVRFPEWREFVLRRALRAGQGFPPAPTPTSSPPSADLYGFSRAERPYLGGADFNADDDDDADSDAWSEREWDGWAYDLDRPRGALPEAGAGGGMKTPHGSPVEREADAELNVEVQIEVELDQSRRRAQSVVGVSPPPPPPPGVVPTPASSFMSGDTLSPPLSPLRTRSATVSASEDPSAHIHAGRMRGLMRGLSMRAGRESIMRSLENALDFVEGK